MKDTFSLDFVLNITGAYVCACVCLNIYRGFVVVGLNSQTSPVFFSFYFFFVLNVNRSEAEAFSRRH